MATVQPPPDQESVTDTQTPPQIIKVTSAEMQHAKKLIDAMQQATNIAEVLHNAVIKFFQEQYGIDSTKTFTVDVETLELRIDS